MKIEFTSLYQVDHNLNSVNEIDLNQQSQDLEDYTKKLFNEITRSRNKRSFDFTSDTTEVRTALDKYLETNYDEAAKINAKRLLKIEIDAQKLVDHLNIKIQKGSLFQVVLKEKDGTTVIISKADHNQFLDEIDFELKNGLPYEKKTFKAFLVKFDVNNKPTQIFVYDTTNRIAKYWWSNYLELIEKHTDKYNTNKSLKLLDEKVFNPIKKDFPADHTVIRNSAIGYFRNNEEFEIDRFVETIIKDYVSVNSEFPKDKITQKIEELPEKWDFDNRFEIVKDEIKKRKVNKVQLSDDIELILKDHIDDLEKAIIAGVNPDGTKYIKIATEVGYERFKRNKE